MVSIHAPVKGATLEDVNPYIDGYVSIHAPVKGATDVAITIIPAGNYVSIHAPVKGATRGISTKK